MKQLMINLAQRWIDRITRAPRGLTDGHGHAFSVDHGLPDRGIRYGGAQTIHNTGTIDIVIKNGSVDAVWFRCCELPYRVSNHDDHTVSAGTGRGSIVAIEFAPNPLED